MGALSGFLSLLWRFADTILDWFKRPRLKIEYLEEWNGKLVGIGGRIIRFHCLIIRNVGKRTAKRCIAQYEILAPTNLEGLEKVNKLHWADKDYSYKTDEPEPVEIGSDETRRLDVFFSSPLISSEGNINDYYASSNAMNTYTSGQPISASGIGDKTSKNRVIGSWMAIPIALRNVIINNQDVPQARLSCGTYKVKIKVCCENGKGDEKEFKIYIKENGNNLIEIAE